MFAIFQVRVIAAFLTLTGGWLAIAGGWLALLGGSPYYIFAGLFCLVAGGLLFMRRHAGTIVYLVLLLLSSLWALWEVGPAFWLLLPRILGPLLIGLWLTLPLVRRRLIPAPARAPWFEFGGVVAATVLLTGVSLMPERTAEGAPAAIGTTARAGDAFEWPTVGNSPHGTRYSPASQINTGNVHQLQPVWTFHTRDLPTNYGNTRAPQMFEATPIKIGDVLFACTPRNIVIALDADTGRQLWRFDPMVAWKGVPMLICRGVTYYKAPPGVTDCPERILVATVDARLIALDAKSGRLCRSFGTGGQVSLLNGMGKVEPGFYAVTSPATIIGRSAVVGGLVLDNMAVDEPPGVVRAFDAVTGVLRWSWDAAATEGADSWVRGSPNAWSLFSADPSLGLVYVPTGGSTPDHFGGNRGPLTGRYANSVVALDGETGRLRWSFQTVHHDVWDYDVPSQPVLADFPVGNGTVPALIQATKQGEIFVLDRSTGKPLTRVKEVPVPRGTVPGERYAPTQPLSVGMPTVGPRVLAESDMWGVSPIDQLWCRLAYRRMEYRGRFTPPSLRPTLIFPGNNGIMNWGSVAVDEARGLMIVNSSYMPLVASIIPRAQAPKTAGLVLEGSAAISPMTGTPYAVRTERPFLSLLGVPCTAPPWGELTAIDLSRRAIVWRRPLGTTRDHAPLGIAVPGVFNQGGSVITAGGVVFIAATLDNFLRAFDVNTGRLLWKARLPAGGQATPMTYISRKTGRQMVVIAAGGHRFMDTTIGDSIVAYALKEK
jgi:quinoprotein glucose dehydrogenase